jgi:ABC-type transport system substrate-binding protein
MKPAVRHAIDLAINRTQLSKVLFNGLKPPATQGAILGVVGYNPNLAAPSYDPAGARQLLAEAGYGSGLELKAKVLLVAIPEANALYEIVAQDLAKVGIHMNYESVLGTEWYRIWYSGDWGADMLSFSMNSALFHDSIRTAENFSCRKPGAFFCDAELDRMIAASNEIFDDRARDRQLQQAMARIKDLTPGVILFPGVNTIAMTPEVRGVRFTRSLLRMEDISVSK